MKNIRVRDETLALIDEVRALGVPYSLITTQDGIVAFALHLLLNPDSRPISAGQIDTMIEIFRSGMLEKLAVDIPVPIEQKRGPGRPKKDDSPIVPAKPNGEKLCEMLEGVLENGQCTYKRYEITPTGKAVQVELSLPVDTLIMKEVEGQYYPNKEAWIARRAEQEKDI